MKTMADVIKEYPSLRYYGFLCKEDSDLGTVDELVTHEADAKIIAQWLRDNFEFSYNRRRWVKYTRSYGWKHIAENVLGEKIGSYVSNGTFIAAAVMAGVMIRPIKNSPNAEIGITAKSFRRFNKARTNRGLSTVYV